MNNESTNPRLQRYEETLLHQKKQLENTMLHAVAQGRQAVAEDTLDIADQAVFSYQKEMLFSQSTEGHNQLSLVRLALDRLDEGTFGECLRCGQKIGEKRLEALPWTPHCIECQEKIENGEADSIVRAA